MFVVFLATALPAEAGNILRMGGSAPSASAAGAAPGGAGGSIVASPGVLAARNALSRASNAVAAVQAMQAAARQIAAGTAASPGLNYLTTHRGLQLTPVPDGLVDNRPTGGAGGLIPDSGLASPGVANPVTTWTGAGTPTQSVVSGQTTVNVVQNAQQALLNWQTFNVGRHTTLNFDQHLGGTNVANWIAFNQINSTGVPSQILGSIQAQGQVYIINPNGIIFGGSSQVNARSLVASSLPINTNLVNNGLLNNPDSQFLFSALPLDPGANGPTPAFTPPAITGVYGDVEVQPGATLTAVPTSDNVGGLVALIGPNVYNGGVISTKFGQTILAAGLQVGLAAHNSNDPTLRGLDAYVGEVVDPTLLNQPAAGTAENAEIDPTDPTGKTVDMGDIESQYGDALMTGSTVNQLGIINSFTSVSYNGRVDLLADYNAKVVSPGNGASPPTYLSPTATGSVVLGSGSVTQILPDMAGQTVVGTQLALPSLVNIQGQTIHLEADEAGDPGTGAIILAPDATTSNLPNPAYAFGSTIPTLELSAGVTLNAGSLSGNSINGYGFFNTANTSITLDPYATIDVSGAQVFNPQNQGFSNVGASVAEDIVPVQLLSAQLANSPLQRNGALYRQTVDVNITQTGNYNGQEWVGTPLADTTGFINLIQRSVGELTTNGGTVALNAGASVNLGANSTVNVSASAINYAGGVVSTAKVISNGQILDIAQATPDLVYSGIFTGTDTITDAKWGVTQTYTNAQLGNNIGGQYIPGYVQWGNAGIITITAPAMALNGNFLGNTSEGPYQRTPSSQINTKFGPTTILPTMQPILGVPAAGTLSLTFEGVSASGTGSTLVAPAQETDISFQPGNSQTTTGNSSTPTAVVLSTDLASAFNPDNSVNPNWAGFGNLAVNDPTGNIYMPNNVTTSAGGNLTLTGQYIKVDGQVSAPSGTLNFTADNISPFVSATPTPPDVNYGLGQFILDPGAALSTAGLIVDDRATASAPGTLPLLTDGGTVSIQAYRIDLQPQSTVDVSGGVEINTAAKLSYGAGGTLNITAVDPTNSQIGLLPNSVANLPPGTKNYYGQVILDPTTVNLLGYSGKAGSGGTLNITAPFIQVGEDPTKTNPLLNGDSPANVGRTLLLQPEFFSQGGFSSFSLTGIGDFALNSSNNVGFDSYLYMPGVVIAPGTMIAPQVSSWMAVAPQGSLALTKTLLPVGQRTPASLTFKAQGAGPGFTTNSPENAVGLRGDLVVYPGANITTDPQGSVTLNGNTVTLMGSVQNPDGSVTPGATITAPGGNISIKAGSNGQGNLLPGDVNSILSPTVDLGPGSVLNASGTTVYAPPNSHGYLTGNVLPGGTISIAGNIVIEAGAELNVNGASSPGNGPLQLEVLQALTGASTAQSGAIAGSNYVPVQEESNGGAISLKDAGELFIDDTASLSGLSGGPMAQGGSFTLATSYPGASGGNPEPQHPSTILTPTNPVFYVAGQNLPGKTGPVTGSSLIVATGVASGPPLVVGNQVVDANGATIAEEGYFGADSFNNGNFASMTLNGTVQFSKAVSLQAGNSITIGNTGVLLADPNPNFGSSLTLNAPYVVFGQLFLPPVQPTAPLVPVFGASGPPAVPPSFGSGSLNVNASDLIDVGNLSLQNIGTANLDATAGKTTNGAIRGDGTLDVAGAITMTAGQIYPPTATTFNIAAYDSSVMVAKSATTSNTVTLASPAPPGIVAGASSGAMMLLGSPVKSISSDGLSVTLAGNANQTIAANTPEVATNSGLVTINAGPGLPALPLSAGGMLNIYAATINQGGVLRAPIGAINLGGSSSSSKDPVSGNPFPSTQALTLAPASITSVSAVTVDPVTGQTQALTIPYGINLNGTSWIDPTGTDITATGNGAVGVALPYGTINLNAANVTTDTGATINLTGGGDLYAYRWVPGLGGSYDILNASYDVKNSLYDIGSKGAPSSSTSFAVIPGYSADYAPYAAYNTTPLPNATSSNFSNPNPNPNDPTQNIVDAGYTSTGLAVGQQVYLGASNGLPAGTYTLLPARYALLPGAFLVTPQSGATPMGTVSRADGSSLVSGYQSNHLSPTQPLFSSFEVDPQSVVLARAEYDPSTANSFLSQSAQTQHIATPRLPVDAGQLVFNVAASQPNGATSLNIQSGTIVDGASIAGGFGGLVDISSPGNIYIEPNGTSSPGNLFLDPSELDGFGAESLLVGGVRQPTTSGMAVSVATANLTVDNAEGAPLTGSDIILAANNNLTVAPGAVVSALNQPFIPAQTLQVGQTFAFTGADHYTLYVNQTGSAISFPTGIPGSDNLIARASSPGGTISGTITPPNGGAPTTFSATGSTGYTISSSTLTPGSTITFNSGIGTLTLANTSGGTPGAPTTLANGDITIGDGTLLRVSSDPSASSVRLGVVNNTPPNMTISPGAQISGASVTLDSTGSASLGSIPGGTAINLDSGRISLQLGTSGSPQGLVLSNGTLQALENSAASLSLLSYSSIDIYDSGNGVDSVGKLDAAGQPTFTSLALHAGEIDDATGNSGDTVQFNARNILLDNSANGPAPVFGSPPSGGSLTFFAGTNTGTVTLGANQLAINQYSDVNLQAGGGITVQGTGTFNATQNAYLGLTTQGSLVMTTPWLTGASNGANQKIAAGGALSITGSAAPVVGGLGASLTLVGGTDRSFMAGIANGVEINSNVTLPSGTLNVEAANGSLSVDGGGTLDVGGLEKTFFDAEQYTSGGQITLTSDAGNVQLAAGSTVNVSAPLDITKNDRFSRVGNAGSLTISAPTGIFAVAANTMYGQGGAGGQGGTFSLDVGSLPSLASLDAALNPVVPTNPVFNPGGGSTVLGGFTQSQTIRVRTGNVAEDGTAAAQTFNLSADQGDVTVAGTGKIVATAAQNGTVDVSTNPATNLLANPGATGGTIDLTAAGSVKLSAGSLLTVEGKTFDHAGKGGAVSLTAGAYEAVNNVGSVNTSGVVTIDPSSTIDLSVDNNVARSSATATANTPVNLNGNSFIIATDPTATTGSVIGQINTSATTSSPLYDNDLTVVTGAQSVTLNNGGAVYFPGSTALGDYTGTLLLSESQPAFGNGTTLINSLGGNIKNPSSIVLAGLQVFDLSGASSTNSAITSISSSGNINSTVETDVMSNGTGFVSNVYNNNKSFFQNNPGVNIEPSAEIVNDNANINGGALTLASTWNLSTFRFSTFPGSSEPGILTLRAAGNLVFDSGASSSASLTDGFGPSPTSGGLWQAPMLPVGSQSWSYNLVAGADFSAADYSRVATGAGSLQLGYGYGSSALSSGSNDAATIEKYYQVIRTGTGNINIIAGQDVQLLNPLAAIYTAGSQAPALPTDEFMVPNTAYGNTTSITAPNSFVYPAQYNQNGGNVTVSAQHDIIHELENLSTVQMTQDSSKELPTNWLYRRGYVNPATGAFALTHSASAAGNTKTNKEIASTTWWIDFSNFFEGVGALGGGNVTLAAGHDVTNVDAVAPTNARVTYQLPNSKGTFTTNVDGTSGTYNQIAASQTLVELGGGDVVVNAGDDINGGVYYVERGSGTLNAGNQILTNSTRSTAAAADPAYSNPLSWLPTTLFLGEGSFDVTAGGNVLLGPAANPFLLPQGINNDYFDKTYFSTYATTDAVDVSSLTGSVTLKADPAGTFGEDGSLAAWYTDVLAPGLSGSLVAQQPWLGLVEAEINQNSQETLPAYFTTAAALMPGTLQATAFFGNINLVGSLTLSPSPTGTIDLAADGSINGLQPMTFGQVTENGERIQVPNWGSSTIDLSDASPGSLPGILDPFSLVADTVDSPSIQRTNWSKNQVGTGIDTFLQKFTELFNESGSLTGTYGVLQTQQALHGTSVSDITGLAAPLHANDTSPVEIYATGTTGDISGLTLFSGKATQVIAGRDITDIALYLQNDNASDVSVVDAGRDIVAYDQNSPLLLAATASGNALLPGATPLESGDIQIGGPGTLEVLAGRNLTLGVGPNNADGTAVGITSIGGAGNPVLLPFAGADVVAGAGFGSPATGLGANGGQLDFTAFIDQFLTPTSSYWPDLLPELQALLPLENFSAGLPAVWPELTDDEKKLLAPQILDTFYLVLRDAGRDHPSLGNYNAGFAAIADLFPANDAWQGDMTLTSREIATKNGGNIDIFAPGGQLTVGLPVSTGSPANQGILTDDGGNISIFANKNVNVGISRIFTLRGGNEIIWSSTGNIAAGASSKTVLAAPPTRVIVNPTSASVETDLAGLATGGGIGVLATVVGVAPGDVDLIAPAGTIDAGDAGIRSSGNLNISAVQVLNASNIQVSGKSTGTPAPPAAPNIASIVGASNSTAASSNEAAEAEREQQRNQVQTQDFPSIITVEVLGYGGGDDGS